MTAGTWTIVFYTTAAGRCPVAEYLLALQSGEAARLRFDLDLLAHFGLDLGAPHIRSLGGKLWELRTRGQMQHRVVYFAAASRQLILLHAFSKKTARTPQAELQKARRRMTDFQERMK